MSQSPALLPVYNAFMPASGEAGVIYVWVSGNPDVAEFRGRPKTQWGPAEKTAFAKLFDGMNAMHQDELLQSRISIILGNQRDHEFITEMLNSREARVPEHYGHARIRHRLAARIRQKPVVEIRHLRPQGATRTGQILRTG